MNGGLAQDTNQYYAQVQSQKQGPPPVSVGGGEVEECARKRMHPPKGGWVSLLRKRGGPNRERSPSAFSGVHRRGSVLRSQDETSLEPQSQQSPSLCWPGKRGPSLTIPGAACTLPTPIAEKLEGFFFPEVLLAIGIWEMTTETLPPGPLS